MRIRVESDVLHNHSLARVSYQVVRGLADLGHEIEIRQRNESDQLDRKDIPDIDRFYEMTQRTVKPDIVFRHGYPPDLNTPSEGKLVVQQPWEFGSFPRDWRYRWARIAEGMVCVSSYVENIVKDDKIPVRTAMIHHGINPEFLEEVEPLDLGLDPNKKTLLFVGGTIMRKGIDVLLDAVEAAYAGRDDVQLVIKDHPFYGTDISGRLEQIKIPVKYIRSFYSPVQMVQLYDACDIFVFPSRGEGFGLPLIEAMARGLTIVTPNHTGLADYATQPDMHIIPCTQTEMNAEAFAGAPCTRTPYVFEPDKSALIEILRTVDVPEDRMRYRDLLPKWEDRVKEYEKFFTEIANAPGKPIYQMDNPTGTRRIGMVPELLQSGRIEEAIKVDPSNPGLRVALASKLGATGDFDGAMTAIDQAVELDPRATTNYLMLKGRSQLEHYRRTNRRKYLVHGVENLLTAAEREKDFPLQFTLRGIQIPTKELQERYDALLKTRKTVSGVMICRNEEKHLDRSLGSIRPFVDELIVVDTGSTDRSLEIAAKYADVVLERPDFFDPERGTLRSFSEARNFSIDQAKCDYIFWIDADDEVPPQTGAAIRRLAADDMGAGSFPVHCPQAHKDGQMSENRVRHYRLFKNLPSIRFTGDIHEQVAPAIIAEGIHPIAVDTPIQHHGYLDASKLDGKYERNLAILLETDNGDDWSGFNLMTTYLLMGDSEKAIEYGESRIDQLDLKQAHAGKYLSTLTGAYATVGKLDEAIAMAERGVESGSNLVEHYYNLGGIYLEKAKLQATLQEQLPLLDKADYYYRQALEAPLFCRGGAVDVDTGGVKALINLGNIRLMRGEWDAAREAFLQVLSKGDNQYARQQIVACYQRLGDTVAANRHAKILTKQSDEEYEKRTREAQELMEAGNFAEGCLAFKRIVDEIPAEPGANLNYAVSLMATDRYEEAISYLERSIGINPTPQAYYQLTRCLRKVGRPLHAAVVCDIATELDPLAGELHYEMGLVCQDLERDKLCIKSLQMAGILGFSPPPALVAAGKSHLRLGNIREALEMARRAEDISATIVEEATPIYDALLSVG